MVVAAPGRGMVVAAPKDRMVAAAPRELDGGVAAARDRIVVAAKETEKWSLPRNWMVVAAP